MVFVVSVVVEMCRWFFFVGGYFGVSFFGGCFGCGYDSCVFVFDCF